MPLAILFQTNPEAQLQWIVCTVVNGRMCCIVDAASGLGATAMSGTLADRDGMT